MNKNKTKAYTLIELLIVISIIGVMASSVLASFNRTKTKSRDARRLQDIQQLYKAISLYYLINNTLPRCTDPGYTGGCDFNSPVEPYAQVDSTGDGVFIPFMSATLKTNLVDPVNDDPFMYYYKSNFTYQGISYLFMIGTILEASVAPPGIIIVPGYESAYILGEKR
jgi:prepilin-type N-terminal cleavage/methylation domain-containing protein